MKIKDCKIVSHYSETTQTIEEVLEKYFRVYVKNQLDVMERTK